MKPWSKKLGAVIIGAALVVTGMSLPASAETPNVITVADSQAGGVGTQQIANPWFNSGSLQQTSMFRALFRSDATLMKVKPDLAESYKLSKDEKTLTVTLKSGLKWSDGEPITGDDVVWSINTALRGAAVNANYAAAFKQIVGGADVSAKTTTNMSGLTESGNTVTFKLIAPQGLLIPILAQFVILPKHSLDKADPVTLNTNAFWKNPVTSGPFKVGTLSPGNFISLVQNTNYEGTPPKITGINVISTSNPVSDARSGKIDYFVSNDPEVARQMLAVSSFKANPTKILFYRYFVYNLTQTNAAFADIKSRQALQYGVDWKNLVKTLYPNQSGAVINSGVPSGQPHHDAKIAVYKFDPAKAKALLKEADFDYSKTIRLRYYNADQTSVNFMTAVAQQLIDLGLKVDVLKFQGDATTELYTTRNYDLALKGLSAFSVAEWFGEYAATATFAKIIGDQPDFTKLTSALAQSTSLRATGKSLASLQALEQKTLLKMPLYLIKQTVYVSKRISGLPSAFGNPLYMYDNSIQNWVAR